MKKLLLVLSHLVAIAIGFEGELAPGPDYKLSLQ